MLWWWLEFVIVYTIWEWIRNESIISAKHFERKNKLFHSILYFFISHDNLIPSILFNNQPMSFTHFTNSSIMALFQKLYLLFQSISYRFIVSLLTYLNSPSTEELPNTKEITADLSLLHVIISSSIYYIGKDARYPFTSFLFFYSSISYAIWYANWILLYE